ncbi:MAG TPA: alpha/beta fold hydrolase [Bryobacteraceae bacterium]|jgi:hypothetical protein|nr:alpha/beta fold hydrolase [Bryobacteraceae bacterium]
MGSATVWGLALLVLTSSAWAAPPCTTATAACTEFVPLGGGPSRSLVYRTYPLDTKNENITRALVVVHGAGRDADNYFRTSLAAAFLAGALDNTIVIAPRMASNDGQGCKDMLADNEISWNCSSWRSGGASLTTPKVGSFDFLDEILRKVARKDVFPNLKTIVVAGHSAGGQVVNRYEMGNHIHETLGTPVSYIVSNPSSYAYPDPTRPTGGAWSVQAFAPGYVPVVDPKTPLFGRFGGARDCTTYNKWPYGMEELSGYVGTMTADQIKHQLVSRPTTYLLGELDVLPLGGFDGSCSAMAEGPTRLARGEAYGKYVNEKFGAKHVTTIVHLCGHNARCMFTSEDALPVLFPKP